MAQCPLLNGGGGEFQPHNDDMDIDTHAEQEIPPMDKNTASLPPLDLPPNIPANVKRYLKYYPYLSDYGQTLFCLSFPSRDRATAPG